MSCNVHGFPLNVMGVPRLGIFLYVLITFVVFRILVILVSFESAFKALSNDNKILTIRNQNNALIFECFLKLQTPVLADGFEMVAFLEFCGIDCDVRLH